MDVTWLVQALRRRSALCNLGRARTHFAISLLLCCACGDYGPVTNNAIAGDWVGESDSGTALQMHLDEGTPGVSGTGDRQGGTPVSFTVSTPAQGLLRFTWADGETDDFSWTVEPNCPGEPHPSPAQYDAIVLTQVSATSGGQAVLQRFTSVSFLRVNPTRVICTIVPGPI